MSSLTESQKNYKGGGKMSTIEKFIKELSQKLASSIVEATNYKVLYEEASEEYERVNELLSKFNDVLDSDKDLKDLFDEVAKKLEKE